jgi:threonine dehydrogenase-like Zn-dependent dehydrogenase
MNGLWLEEQTLSYRDDLPLPNPSQGEALVRVRLAGICSTDLELVRGYYPFTGIPGHEFVGEIEVAEGASDREGERVVGEINAVCGECERCLAGYTTHCRRRTVLGIVGRDGAFAEYLTLPLANLHEVPDSVPDEAAVFTEPLAAALEIQEQVHVHPTDRVLVVGAGRLGQLIAGTLSLTGCALQVVARYPEQRDLLDSYGVAWIDESGIPGESYDLVVEATGTSGGFAVARAAVRPRGVIVLKSTYKGDVNVDFSSVVVDEITLVGSRCGPFPPALALLSAGQIDPKPLIHGRYTLEEGIRAFSQAGQSGVLKVLLELSSQ